MTLGEMISDTRKSRGMKQDELARTIGLSAPALSGIENDSLKNGPDPQLVIRIADALACESILYKYIEDNPVYRAIIPKVFPDLNNIRTEPAVIFNKVAREADEARLAALELGEIFGNADPRRVPDFENKFKSNMQQIVDIKRCVEILETQLIASHIINQSGLLQIYAEQQAKCEANGHHIPEQQRTGTEG
jgi:transcriptional regulator with XRE-family HTH domain